MLEYVVFCTKAHAAYAFSTHTYTHPNISNAVYH